MTSAGATGHGGRAPRRAVVLLFAGIVGLALLALAEGGARFWLSLAPRLAERRARKAAPTARLDARALEAAGRALDLDPYEMADAEHPGRWRLRPGYRATIGEILEAKRRAGRTLSVRLIEEQAPRLGLRPETLAVEVNAEGYRGPALDAADSRMRILTLGDSCTFGSPFSQWHTYPRSLERELQRRGLDVEVVNGGVEGYGPSDVLVRIREFQALKPQLTTLYIGWNALYTERFVQDHTGWRNHLASARLMGRALEITRARWGGQRAAQRAFNRPKRPDRGDAAIPLLDEYTPSFFAEVEQIVDEMTAAGSRVVLVTLPGLYSMDRDPTRRMLEVGHLPTFTDNPFVLARMVERYNAALRELAARRGLTLVDLDQWSRRELVPPEDYFVDSVHLDERSQERAGVVLADGLEPLLRAAGPSSAAETP